MQVIITRAKEDCEELKNKLAKLDIESVCIPCIEYHPPSDNYQALDMAIRNNHNYDWIFFLSKRAAESFFDRLLAIGGQLFHLSPHIKIACVGQATADFVDKQIGFPVDFVPSQFNSETMFAEFKDKYKGKILLVREESLVNENIDYLDIEVIAAYRSCLAKEKQIALNQTGFIIITSSQIAKNFHKLHSDNDLSAYKFLSIGQQSSKTLRELFPEAEIIEAAESSLESLLEMLKYQHGREKNQI
jgi:uroporphyrinogen-III synthase